MRAFQVSKIGEPAELSQVTAPNAACGEVLVKISTCGLNFADLLMQTGQYQDTPPCILELRLFC